MRIVKTKGMPEAGGHYSPCIEHNGMLYLSGQLPRDPYTKNIPETIEEQTLVALNNVERIVVEGGSSKAKILQMRLYISNVNLWDKVNKIYGDFFGNHKPVRSVIPTRDLHFGCLIEIEAIAVLEK